MEVFWLRWWRGGVGVGLMVVIAVRDMGAKECDGGDIGVTGIWGGVEGGGDGEGLGW